ncbi:UDP-N-acetylglucosamine 1-carboxyvinyltransferase, partial [Listeria innocua]
KFKLEGRSAVVSGPVKLQGSKVTATDLRAGAALVIAGLLAEGTTEIHGVEHIERGYSKIIEKLSAIGADITRSTAAETKL